jgi:hypothetical protein
MKLRDHPSKQITSNRDGTVLRCDPVINRWKFSPEYPLKLNIMLEIVKKRTKKISVLISLRISR